MSRRLLKMAAAVAVLAAVAVGAARLPELVDSYLGIERAEMVPTFPATAGTYQIAAAGVGELSGVQTSWLRVPRVKTGSLRIAWLAPNGALLDEGEVVVRFDDGDARLMVDENSRQLEAYGHRMTKAEIDSEGARQVNRLEVRDAELEVDYSGRQVRRDETIFSQWEIRESLVSAALARHRREYTTRKGTLQERLATSDREILTIESAEVERGLEEARKTLNSLMLRMPSEGVVLHPLRSLNPLQPGLEVYPNSRLLEIASLQNYRGTIHVPEKEATLLEVDQPVSVVIAALSPEPVSGRLSRVSPVARQISRQDPRKYFECDVTLEVDPELMARLRPGMKLRAEVLVDTLEGAFAIPKAALHRKEEGHFVFVRQGEDFVQQAVTVRGSDHVFVVVEGLRQGSRVALRNPDGDQDSYLPDFSAPAATATRRFIIAFD